VIHYRKLYCIFISAILFFTGFLECRSIHRPSESWLPTINVRWADEHSRIYTLRNAQIQEATYFNLFDINFFYRHLLTDTTPLTYRYQPETTIPGKHLNNQMEVLLQEIRRKKKTYTHFTILQDTDFNRRKSCGLLVLKFNDYPFVLKLCIETPKSFTNPLCKGFEPVFLFYLGGGVNRHLSGFTRIKNAEFIKQRLTTHDYWNSHADIPRKWYWLPKSARWFDITGHNVSGKDYIHTQLPSTYGIIADAIEAERGLTISSAHDRAQALELCNYLDLYADPNISNFMVEKNSGKLIIVDTEHFPTIGGFKKKEVIGNYFEYFASLISKCGKAMFFSTKKERKEAYKNKSELMLT
jgi:hypothetical protein